MKKLFTLLTMLIVAITSSWADETYYLQTPGASTPALTGDFYTTATLSQDVECSYNDVNYTKAVKMAGNLSAWSSNQYLDRMIRYDCKTTKTDFTVVVYSKGSNKSFYVGSIKESALGSALTPSTFEAVSAPQNAVTPKTYSITSTTPASFYVSSNASGDLFIVQIIAVESGDPLPTPGTPGYYTNFNKGRIVCPVSSGVGQTYLDNSNYEFNLYSTYKGGNSTEAKIRTKGSNYVKFTTTEATKLTVAVSSSNTYYISSTIDASETPAPTAYTATAEDVELAAGTWYIVPNGSEVKLTGLSFAASTPATPYKVTFNAGEHGTCATSSETEASAGAGVTLPTVTANDGYAFNGWYTDATEGTKVGDAGNNYKPTDDVTIFAQYSELSAPTKPSITGVPGAAVAKNASVTLTASSTGAPTPTYQWYTCDSEGGNQAEITGAGGASYSPATTSLGTTYYIVKASNSVQSGVASDVVAIQVVGSSECKLTEAKYSNGFNAFINESAKTVKAYYLAGTSAPTISSTQISTGATVDTSNPSSIVVTAEDGTTTATYAVEVSSVEPYSGIGRTFDGSESWIKTGGGYTTTSGEKVYYAWVINKNATNDDRIPLGKTRIYFFVDNATSITLINDRGTALKYDRDIKVYVNGTKLDSPTSMPKYNANTPASITITTGAAAMVEIASNQDGGDTGWGKIVVNGTSMNLPLNDSGSSFTKGFATFCSSVNFTVSEGATAYKAAIADSKLTMTALDGVIPANTGVVIAGNKNGNATITATTAAATADVTDNDLKGTTAAALTADLKGSTAAKFLAFKKTTSTFTPYGGENFPANKAYLLLDSNNNSLSLEMVFEEATGINNVNAAETEAQASPVKVIKNGKLYIGNYNVAGQQVK